jgi:hypothetical protein
MPPKYRIMPLDKTTIRTRIRLHPDFVANPDAYRSEHDLPIRTMKPTRGWRAGRATWNLTLDVLTYKGIKAKMMILAGDPLASITIDFNPGVCLHGHNGRIITLTEFLHALAILVTHLTPLLSDPDDWVDLVPGVRREGRA